MGAEAFAKVNKCWNWILMNLVKRSADAVVLSFPLNSDGKKCIRWRFRLVCFRKKSTEKYEKDAKSIFESRE